MRTRVVLVLVALAVATLPAAVGSAAGPPLPPLPVRPPTCLGVLATLWGTAGADVLYGTGGNDVIAGLGGDDLIYGLAGDDVMCGGDGDDTIYGGAGKDVLDSGEGAANRLYGQRGRDRIVLARVVAGDDQLVDGGLDGGGELGDILDLRSVPVAGLAAGVHVDLRPQFERHLGPVHCVVTPPDSWQCDYREAEVPGSFSAGYVVGIEAVYGSPGNDMLWGGWRSSVLRGEGGDDVLIGGTNNDRLLGGSGNDWIDGAWGNDLLNGGAGIDYLEGYEGVDTCVGGETTVDCEL